MTEHDDQQSIFDADLEQVSNSFFEFAKKHNINNPVYILHTKTGILIGYDQNKNNIYDAGLILKEAFQICQTHITKSLNIT